MKARLNLNVILFGLVLSLNLLMRLPVYSHEMGVDSFVVHILANTLNEFGYAKWWLDPMSVGGFYPYSDASSLPFLLSGISQLLSIDVEKSILLLGFVLGFFGIVVSYILAGLIMDNDIFKIIVVILYSLSPAVLDYTTWTAPTRTLFVLYIPLFVYCLLKTKYIKYRFISLSFILFLFMALTSHMFYFLLPVIGAYMLIEFLSFTELHYSQLIPVKPRIFSLSFLVLFLTFIFFIVPFFNGMFMDQDHEFNGSKYAFLSVMFFNYLRYSGPAFILSLVGFVYLIFKDNKTNSDWFLILSIVFLVPFTFIPNYMKWFIPIFLALLAGYSFMNIVSSNFSKRHLHSYIVVLILFILLFSGYYQSIGSSSDRLDDDSYVSAKWINEFCNGNVISNRKICAISETSTLTGSPSVDISYDFVNLSSITIVQKYGLTSPNYYFGNPYSLDGPDTSWDFDAIMDSNVNDGSSFASRLVTKHNLTYYGGSVYDSRTFVQSIKSSKNMVYSSGSTGVFVLK